MLSKTSSIEQNRRKAAWREWTSLERTTRRNLIVVTTGFVLALGFDAIRGIFAPEARIAAGYAAKVACSAYFGNAADGVRRDVAAIADEELSFLPGISLEVDDSAATIRASWFPFASRVAVWIDGRGSVLLPEGFDADHPAVATLRVESSPREGVDEGAPWPRGEHVEIPQDAPKFDAAMRLVFDDAADSPPLRTRAIVIVHRGAIVAERYAAGFGPKSVLPAWSVTKSITNALVGILVGEGKLQPNAPVDFDEWRGDARAAITLENLLRMESGLAFDENYADPASDVLRMLFSTNDMARFAATRPLERRPGEKFHYASGSSLLVQRAIRGALDDDVAYRAFPAKRLFDPIHAKSAFLEADNAGTFVGSSYAHATARDFARFGLLYLDDGMWQGKRLLPEGFVAWSTTPSRSARNGEYGAHWWLNRSIDGRAAPFPNLPGDLFLADGFEGQYVIVVPSKHAVIVRLGNTPAAAEFPFERFVGAVLAELP